MRRVILSCMVLLLIVPVGFAQQDATGLPPCTSAEIQAARQTLQEQQLFLEARAGLMETEQTFEDYRTLVADYDAFSITFWDEVFPTLPACAEVYYFGYTTGLLIDEALILVLLRWQALYETEYGDPDFAAFFTDAATTRAERLPRTRRQFNALMMRLTEMTNLPACTEGDAAEFWAVWESTIRRYLAIDELSQGMGMPDLDLVIRDYAALSLEWREARTDLVTCAEAFHKGFFIDYVINQNIIVNSLFRIAILEDQFGNRDLSDTLLQRGNERLTALLEVIHADPDLSDPTRFEATPDATQEPS